MDTRRKLEIMTSLAGLLGALVSLIAVLIRFAELTPDFWVYTTLVLIIALICVIVLQSAGILFKQEWLKVLDKILKLFYPEHGQDNPNLK